MYRPYPLITIGIPTYNQAAKLTTALRSIQEQPYKEIEILVSDNASNDATEQLVRALAREDPRILYIQQPVNIGRYRNMDYLRKQARGKYYMQISEGDELEPRVLSTYVEFLEKHPEYVTAMGVINYWENDQIKDTESELSLENPRRHKRTIQYYSKVDRGALFHGLHRTHVLNKIPMRKCMAGDWHLMAAMAFAGKVKQFNFVGYHKNLGDISRSFKRVETQSGKGRAWILLPSVRIAIEAWDHILYQIPLYRNVSDVMRLRIALAGAWGIIRRYYGYHFPKILGGKLLRTLNIPTPRERRELKAQSINPYS